VAESRTGWWGDVRSLGVFGRSWALGVFLFSGARALVAWPTLGRYGVDPWVFLVIDIVTAVPYGVGQAVTVKILRDGSRSPADAAGWAVVVGLMFMAPYAYIFLASGDMPLYAYAGVILWMAVFGVLAALRMRRQISSDRRSNSPPTDGGRRNAA
jgi:hypothetical protein